MKVSEFMNQALFRENTGYYKSKNPIGRDGDFITSPEISQVFGEILAAYLLQISTIKNNEIALVEMGAGAGTLFKDILHIIKKLAAKNNEIALSFLQKTSFHIIEINPVLVKRQKQNLSDFKVFWHENIEKFAKNAQNKEIFFISNELFDCFAIDQYVLSEIGWRERVVIPNQYSKYGQFSLAKFDKEIDNFVKSNLKKLGIEPNLAPMGAVFEYSQLAHDFMNELCFLIKKQGGIAINIDYGYVKNNFINSLQAVKNHKKCDILKDVGQCDITALVDFTSLSAIIKEHNLEFSLVTQAQFLQNLGIEQRRQALLSNNPDKKEDINSAIDRLINPDKMGELFKFLIFWT